MMPAISVVVPVYNSVHVLPRCIDSILGQSFHELELILVDDGSTDGSGELCEQYAVRDARVRCLHQTNSGQAAARLAGVEMSKGEWVTFVDNDDTLIPTALLDLSIVAADHVDIVLGNGESLHGERRDLIPISDFRHLTVKGEGQIGLIWGSLYRRSCITPYLFDVPADIRTGEDYIFWVRLVFHSEKPVRVLYKNIYRKGADSFSSSFVWTTDYAAKIHSLRKNSIPSTVRGEYMAEMIDDRIDNLFTVAAALPRKEWVHSQFYKELMADIRTSNYKLPLKRHLFLALPSRWLRQCYSIISNILHASGRHKAE